MKWGGEQQEIGERWRVMSCMYQAKESRPFFLYNRRWRNFKASKREITRFVFYKENWQCENGTGGGQDRIWEISFKEVFIQWRRPQSLGRQLVRHSVYSAVCPQMSGKGVLEQVSPLHRAGQVKTTQEGPAAGVPQGPPSSLGHNVLNIFQTDSQKSKIKD